MIFAATLLFIILSAGVAFSWHARVLMEENVRTQLRSMAGVAAMQFNGDEIRYLGNFPSAQYTVLQDIVRRLHYIRSTTPSVRYAYIMRRTADPNILEFVADADSFSTADELDLNGNQRIDEDETPSMPGDLYDASNMPALRDDAFISPSVDADFTQDSWGNLISGYAPIYSSDGVAVAVLGIDMNANDYIALSSSLFSPVAFLLLIILAVLLVGFVLVHLWRRRLDDARRMEMERSGMLMLAFHQLGTPLTIFKWSLEEIKDLIEKGPPYSTDLQDHVINMQSGIQKLNRVINEISEVVLIERGTKITSAECALLSRVIPDAVSEFSAHCQKTGQSIVCDLAEGLCVKLERKLFIGVMREILENALIYSSQKSVVTIRAKKKGNVAHVEVEDHGVGISPIDQQHLFEKFIRGKDAHIYDPDGTGVGLAIVKGIIEHSGGRVWIRSTQWKGTTVSFFLPLGESEVTEIQQLPASVPV
jgi:signal transduction histidine kinase